MEAASALPYTSALKIMESKRGETMRLLSLGKPDTGLEYLRPDKSVADGGGIRGLSSLYILQDLMYKIMFVKGLETEPPPCDYFDMMCGTSTGGYVCSTVSDYKLD
jgi:hypothetical protein